MARARTPGASTSIRTIYVRSVVLSPAFDRRSHSILVRCFHTNARRTRRKQQLWKRKFAARDFRPHARPMSLGDGRTNPTDRLLPPQAAGRSCYSVAEEIMPGHVDYLAERRGFRTTNPVRCLANVRQFAYEREAMTSSNYRGESQLSPPFFGKKPWDPRRSERAQAKDANRVAGKSLPGRCHAWTQHWSPKYSVVSGDRRFELELGGLKRSPSVPPMAASLRTADLPWRPV